MIFFIIICILYVKGLLLQCRQNLDNQCLNVRHWLFRFFLSIDVVKLTCKIRRYSIGIINSFANNPTQKR